MLVHLRVCSQESCESSGEAILDLVDYCQRRMVSLMAEGEGPRKGGVVQELDSDGEDGSNSEDDEREEKKKEILKVSVLIGR